MCGAPARSARPHLRRRIKKYTHLRVLSCGNLYGDVFPLCLFQPLEGFGSHLYAATPRPLTAVGLYQQVLCGHLATSFSFGLLASPRSKFDLSHPYNIIISNDIYVVNPFFSHLNKISLCEILFCAGEKKRWGLIPTYASEHFCPTFAASMRDEKFSLICREIRHRILNAFAFLPIHIVIGVHIDGECPSTYSARNFKSYHNLFHFQISLPLSYI